MIRYEFSCSVGSYTRYAILLCYRTVSFRWLVICNFRATDLLHIKLPYSGASNFILFQTVQNQFGTNYSLHFSGFGNLEIFHEYIKHVRQWYMRFSHFHSYLSKKFQMRYFVSGRIYAFQILFNFVAKSVIYITKWYTAGIFLKGRSVNRINTYFCKWSIIYFRENTSYVFAK